MRRSNNLYQDESVTGHHDFDSILFIQECEILSLVDFLIHDLDRLCHLVMEARQRANGIAVMAGYTIMDLPYLMAAEDLFDGSFDDHPCMRRYEELYGRRHR